MTTTTPPTDGTPPPAADAIGADADGRGRHPVDRIPPPARLLGYGLQHVLAMYAGAVAVPVIVGGAMVSAGRMEPSDLPHLIVADLFVAGIASILQSLGVLRMGSRLPLMQGVSFAAVAPMITIGQQHGITAIYGAVIATGLLMMLAAPFFARLVRFFPPLVTGTVITIIGLSLMKVCAGWVAGGPSGGPSFGRPMNFAMAGATLAIILAVHALAPRELRPMAVLAGIVVGTGIAWALGEVDASGVGEAAWLSVPTPFLFGAPEFPVGGVLTMIIVGLVIMTETTGDIIAVGQIVGRPADRRTIGDGLRADGFSTFLGGVFNTFPYSAFAQNVGLVSMSKVASRYVATMAGGILIVFGLLPKMGEAVAAIPQPVLGGAGLVLFGMVAASGIRTLAHIRLTDTKALVVAVSVSIGMLPTVLPGIYDRTPEVMHPLLESGISAGALTAIILNLVLLGVPTDDPASPASPARSSTTPDASSTPDASTTGTSSTPDASTTGSTSSGAREKAGAVAPSGD